MELISRDEEKRLVVIKISRKAKLRQPKLVSKTEKAKRSEATMTASILNAYASGLEKSRTEKSGCNKRWQEGEATCNYNS